MQAQNEHDQSIKKSLINKAVDMLVHNTGDNGLFQQTKTFIDNELNNKHLDPRLKQYFGNIQLVKNNFYLKGLVREYLKKAVDEKKSSKEILNDLANIDVRFDVEKSAAIIAVNYIRVRQSLDMYKNISNTDKHNLALAIYNCGEGTGRKIAELMNRKNIPLYTAMQIIKEKSISNNTNIHLNLIDTQRRDVIAHIYDIKNKSTPTIKYDTNQEELFEAAKSKLIANRLHELATNTNTKLKLNNPANASDDLVSAVNKINNDFNTILNSIKDLEQKEKEYLKNGNLVALKKCRERIKNLYTMLALLNTKRREDGYKAKAA